MTIDSKNYPPLRFIDKMKGRNHLMLFYDKPEFGQLVQYRFLANGLKRTEHCIVVTHDDPKLVEDEMSNDIDVAGFKKKNLLHIHQIENILDSKGGIEKGFEDILRQVTADAKPPYRFVGRVIPDISSKKGIEAELVVEQKLHTYFYNYNGSFLCTYNVAELEPSKRNRWLGKLLENHHSLIYATEPEKAVVFDPELLKPTDY